MARRAHALGGCHTIEDAGLREAWAMLLGSIARQPAPPPAERLKAAVLLLAQARLLVQWTVWQEVHLDLCCPPMFSICTADLALLSAGSAATGHMPPLLAH